MTDVTADPEEEPKKGGKGTLLIGLVLAIVGAAGGFFAVQSGIVPVGGDSHAETSADHAEHLEEALVPKVDDIAFVQIPTVVVSYARGGQRQILRFSAEIEVGKTAQPDVETLVPRIVDVLNSYLQALELDDIDEPMALTRIRAQMLRRIQIVAGREAVRDLLIMEFVLT
ncbi:MAG: flagellar basal body-associated FliL family protein [Ruegeria sp.]